MRRFLPLSLLFFAGCLSPSADAPLTPLHQRLDGIVNDHLPPGALCAWHIEDATTGEVLSQSQSRLLLHPASTLKTITAAAFLQLGGLQQPIETSLWATGDGRLVLFGGGDPLLSSQDILTLAAAVPADLRAAAIEVDGSLFGRPGFGEGWMWDDEPYAFQPIITALTIDRGVVTIRGETGPQDALFWTASPGTGWFRRRDHPGTTLRSPTRALKGPARLIEVPLSLGPDRNAVSQRLSVRDPDLWAGAALRAALENRLHPAGSPLPDGLPPALDRLRVSRRTSGVLGLQGARKLATVRRDPKEVLRESLLHSDNLCSESLMALIGTRAGPLIAPGKTAVAAGLLRTREWLRRIGVEAGEHALADGSGVSHYNLVTAHALVRVQAAMRSAPAEQSGTFFKHLPQLGQSGTLARRAVGEPGAANIRAKTGGLRAVDCLAGEALTADGRPLDFAILVQNSLNRRASRDLIDAMVLALARSHLE